QTQDEAVKKPIAPTPDGTVWSPSHQMGIDPLHTSVRSEPVSTPGFWRLFTTAIMLRYGPLTLIPTIRSIVSKSPGYQAVLNQRVMEETNRFISPETSSPPVTAR